MAVVQRTGIDVGLQASRLAPTHFVPGTIRTLACANDCVDPSAVPVEPIPEPRWCLAVLQGVTAAVDALAALALTALAVQGLGGTGIFGTALLMVGGAAAHAVSSALYASDRGRSEQAAVLDAMGTASVAFAAGAVTALSGTAHLSTLLPITLLLGAPFALLVVIRTSGQYWDRRVLTALALLSAAAGAVIVVPSGHPYVGVFVYQLVALVFWLSLDALGRALAIPRLGELSGGVTVLHASLVSLIALVHFLQTTP